MIFTQKGKWQPTKPMSTAFSGGKGVSKASTTTFNNIGSTISDAYSSRANSGGVDQYSVYAPTAIQPKLAVNKPNDVYEKEADAIAEKVVGSAEGKDATSRSPGTVEPQLQLKTYSPVNQLSPGANNIPTDAVSSTGGNRMDKQTERFMSARFGSDFSNVKINTDERAASMNRELNAKAFTLGKNIYFNDGEYDPQSTKGKRLLAHELTHTIQQGKEEVAIQKEDKDKPAAAKPEINFDVLPPDLKIRMWHLLFEADTSAVKLDYETKGLKTGLSYKYGGALSLHLKSGATSGSVGYTPGENQFSLGLSHGPFNAGISATPDQQKYGFKLGVGDKLLPNPSSVGQTFTTGGTSAGSLLTGAPGALDDPIGFNTSHKSDIDNISKSVDLVKDITDAGKKKIRFGGDFSLSYDPEKKFVFTVRAGMIYHF